METENNLLTNRITIDGDNDHPAQISYSQELDSFEVEVLQQAKEREYQRQIKEELYKERERQIEKNRKAVSIFKLLFFESSSKEKLIIIIAILGSMGAGAQMPLFAILFGRTIDDLGPRSAQNDKFMQTISQLCLNFLYVGIAMFISGFIMVWLWTYSGRILVRKLKEEYFKSIMKQEQKWFDETDPYQFATKIQTQCTTMENGLGEKVGSCIQSFSMFSVCFIVGFSTSWLISLVLCSMLPLIALGGMLITKTLQEGARKNRKLYEQAGGIAEEVLYKIKTIASFANYFYENERFNDKLEKSYQAGKSNAYKLGIGNGIIFTSIFGTYCLAIWYGSRLISEEYINTNDGKKFTAGIVITSMYSIAFGAMSLGQASPAIKIISEACSAASDLFDLKKRVPKIDLTNSTQKPVKDQILGKLTFKNVKFSYNLYSDIDVKEINKMVAKKMNNENIKLIESSNSDYLFENLNFEINPGQKTAFVGKSGCGKSTIVNLIERLYEVTDGEILLDGLNIKELDLNYFRSMIGYVPQEPVLFNTTIRENIIFGRENITDEMIKEACTKAYADEFIFKNDMGLDYIVGIKGSKLSGGQKQRIAIARAILLKPKILILDEATSALDNKSEKEVQTALNMVSKGITTIIIAHRLSTIINANNIMLINKGTVAESGTHNELLKLNGKYARLVKNQLSTVDEQPSKENLIEVNETKIEDEETRKQQDGLIVLLKKKEEEEKQVKVLKKKLLPILMEKKLVIIFGTFFACCTGAVWPCYALLLSESIAALSNPDMKYVSDNGFILSMCFIGLAFGAGICQYFQNFLFQMQGDYLTKRLRSLVFEKYLRLPMKFYDKPDNTPGALLTKLSSDTTKINGIALSMVSIFVQTLSTVILGVSLAIAYNWKVGLINLCFLPLIVLTSALQWKLKQGFSNKDEYIESLAGSILSETVCNTKTIFSYNMQDKVVEMYVNILGSKDKDGNKASMIHGVLFGLSSFILMSTYATLFYAGSRFFADSKQAVDLSGFLKAIMCIVMAGIGLGQAQQYVGDMNSAKKALLNVFRTLDIQSSIDPMADNPNSIKKMDIKGNIEFKNVSFAYPSTPHINVFSNFSIKIEAGKSVAFVGYSGCGKSTVIQLIERFYDVDSGDVLIDNINIKDYDLVSLRKQISLVMQEPVLFNEDIIKNVNYGDLEKGYKEVEESMKNAKIAELLSQEYDKKVIPVSGGQKQRLAIARAMIRNPKILLLDEATSALDKKSEEQVQETLNEAMKGRTCIIIAHRLSTIEHCDVIYVMDKGRIIEQGSHKELMKLRGRYCFLYEQGKKAIQ